MGIRYPALAIVNLLAGGFLVVSVFAFQESTISELGFAVSIGVAVFGLAMIVAGLQRDSAGFASLGFLTAALAGWTIVATQVFSDSLTQWLVFGSGAGHVAIAVATLMLYEISTERVVHHLEVGQREEVHTR